jgi:type IV/VI secretion system ImpK/VasF family protein
MSFCVRIASAFFSTVLQLHEAAERERPPVRALREPLIARLHEFRAQARAAGIAEAEIEDACFALVAWADEAIASSQAPGAEEWRRDPLQLLLFDTAHAGNEFHERLARLGPDEDHAREIFFFCLALGFQGELGEDEGRRAKALEVQHAALYGRRRALGAAEGCPLAPAAYAVECDLEDLGARPTWPVAAAAAGLPLLTHLGVWSLLAHTARAVGA